MNKETNNTRKTNDSDKNKNYKVSTQAGKRVFFKNLTRKAGKEHSCCYQKLEKLDF